LEWLRTEFKLSEEQLKQVRKVHEGYLPQCREYCRQIAAGQQALQQDVTAGAEPETLEARLKEIALLRVQCQAAMLRHFREVSRAMPSEQGRRYLAEMQRLTLGSHDQFEKSMSSGQPSSLIVPPSGASADPHEGHHH
jgi:hypothetical protein